MLKQRIITALVLLPIALVVFSFSKGRSSPCSSARW